MSGTLKIPARPVSVYFTLNAGMQRRFSLSITSNSKGHMYFPGNGTHQPIDTYTQEPQLQTHILSKVKITWGEEADLLPLPGTSHAEELFHVKDNCINEIFMCSHYTKTLHFITKILCS